MSRRRPGKAPEAAAEAKAERRARGVLFWTLTSVAVLLVVALVIATAGRLAVLTPAGRDLVTSFVAGKSLGRYGRINVEGLSGDLWDDFTLERVTVTDSEGVWLEAREVRVDWSYWPLLVRRFHADMIEAETIRLIRRPQLEPRVTPPGPQPLTVEIEAFEADVELLEGFSEEYGRWRLEGDVVLERRGRKAGRINAASLSRPGDYLRADFETAGDGGFIGGELEARAFEARGGPIAGALGYSPDQPFRADVDVRAQAFDVRVRTGEYEPIRAQGRFSAEGGRGSGYVSFLGSDLLAPFAERLGPTARFGVALVPIEGRESEFGIGWNLAAENIRARARGAVDRSGASADSGLTLSVSTPSLSRLVGQDLAQAATVEGVWRGSADRWNFAGDVTASAVDVSGYGLRQASGPVRLTARNGRIALESRLAGEGGSGDSVLARMLGARPSAFIRAARLPDSRILVERFDLDGAALDVHATGSRGAGGRLTAEGSARISDVSAVRRQASGALDLEWRASHERGSELWGLSFEAAGRRLETGWGELDRLLGASPRLTGEGALGGGRIAVSRASLTGAAGRLNAQGLIGLGGRDVRLALDWAARGPFGVGPIEIDGAASGRGSLTGTLGRPTLDLIVEFDALEAGPLSLADARVTLTFRRGDDASDGRVSITGDSNYGPARGSSLFRIADDGVSLTDLDVNAGGVVARGAIALRGRTPSSADLVFEARPGAFLAAGTARGVVRLTDGPADAAAFVDVTGRGIRFSASSYTIRTLNLQGQGTLSHLPFTLQADVGGTFPVSFDGAGVYSRTDEAQTVTLQGAGRVREVAYRTRSPAVLALADGGRVVRVDLAIGGGVLDGSLRQDADAAVIRASLQGVDLQSLSRDLAGRISAEVDLSGTGETLAGTLNARLENARSRDAGADMDIDALIQATLGDNRLAIRAEASDAGGVRSEAVLNLPVTASAAPLRLAVSRTEPMSGEVMLQGQIRSIWDLVLGGERSLSGIVDGRATLGGTINAPSADGYLNISDGRFEDGVTGLTLEGLTLRSELNAETARIVSFQATDGRGEDAGRVTGSGVLGLRLGSASNLTLQLTDFRVVDTDLATARGTGTLRVNRAESGAITLAGDLNVTEAVFSAEDLPNSSRVVELDVIEINRPGGLEDETEESEEEAEARRSNSAIRLDIGLSSDGGGVFVTGRGLDVELALNAEVGGSLASPVLSGSALVVRGDYQFGGRRFIFERGGRISLSTNPERIRLNLTATREDPTLTARIRVTGTAARPIITLTSTPQLPQDEILSQVLFGRSASQLSPIEAAQLASSVAALAGGGGFDVIGNLREFAGLDRLSFGGDASGLTVAGGKYIGDDLYFEVIGGGAEGAAVQVEWRARRNISVISRVGGEGEARISVRWRRQTDDGGRRRLDRED
ncbi:translocation/assembly module TamB domain-containing protein [Brevundimonas sp.]|uniref:translocation/assembly module TamB domain-containing protein n=1 Tax=Brevundimonas sp. TaxID=1871086 RepID=UPI0025DED33E|nr:translocation/assembly module TamB domain-containing protein [Brevundimonas sp.]